MTPDIPVITMGHSFGARLLSRAAHSRFMLVDTPDSDMIDLAIDFQGPYPVTRFLEKRGNNGGLYTVDDRVKLHVLTTSRHDKALVTAFWSVRYAGRCKAREKLNEQSSKRFKPGGVDSTGKLKDFPAGARKVVVNAESMINEPKGFPSGAHGDVADKEAGRLYEN